MDENRFKVYHRTTAFDVIEKINDILEQCLLRFVDVTDEDSDSCEYELQMLVDPATISTDAE